MKAVEEADELLAASRVHREFQCSLNGYSAAVCEVRSRRRLNWNYRIELLCELRHVTVVVIGAAHMNQLFCLLLDSSNYLWMAMSGRTDSNAGIAIQKQIPIDVLNPDAAGPFRNEFK